MATEFPISVEVDIAEPRIELDSLCVTAGGRPERQAWEQEISTSTLWRDPLRRRVMLAPLPLTSAWRTTTTGNYVRHLKTDYTLTTSAAWKENHRGVAGNIYLEGNGTNERVTTATSYSADQPFFISVYVPGVESLGEQTILECGWGTYSGSTTISLRFRANGGVAVYKGSAQIGYQDLDYAATKTGLNKSLGLTTVNILLLPIRRRDPAGTGIGGELLIITDAMTAYMQGFEDAGAAGPITPAGVFWWTVPIGRPSVLMAACKFETAGTLYGPLQTLRYAPNTPRTFTGRGFYASIGASATATYSLVDSAGSAYTPNGSTVSVRGKVVLAGSGTNSICVEAVDWYMPPEAVNTVATEKANITTAIEDIEFGLDDHGVATCRIRARRGMLDTANVEGLLNLSDRPFRIFATHPDTSAEVDIMRGILHAPTWEPADGLGNGASDVILWEGQDRSYEMEAYQYGDTVADDGKLFTDALEDVMNGCGFDSADLVISTSTARVTQSSEIPMGEWALLPQRGDTLASHLDKLFDTFAANWWRGWTPTSAGYKWRAYAPADLSTTPAITLYESYDDAIAAGLTPAQAKHRTIRKLVRHGTAPEANQVIVIGQNPYNGRLILSQDNLTAAQTPITAPSARPITWRGRVHRVLELDPSISTQAMADYVQETLFERITAARHLVDFSSTFLQIFSSGEPMWLGGVVRLYLSGRATYEDYRIIGLPSVRLPLMATPAMYGAGSQLLYDADYRGERIATGP